MAPSSMLGASFSTFVQYERASWSDVWELAYWDPIGAAGLIVEFLLGRGAAADFAVSFFLLKSRTMRAT